MALGGSMRLSPSWRERVFLGLFAAILGFRIVLALQVPSDSSEVLRHLGFTAHVGELGVRFYTATPKDFRPEPWTSVWTNRHYNCPPVALAFFALFSSWGLGIAWVKLALTFADAVTAFLFRRDLSRWGSLLFFASPVAMFYGSHEGQLEPLQTLFIVLAAAATRREKWFRSGLLFALSVQVKVFGALLVPWIAYRLLARGNRSDLVRFSAGCLVGVLPFAGFYWVSPGAMWASVWRRGPDSFNPFWWNAFDSAHRDWLPDWLFVWMSIVTSTMLGVAVCSALQRLRSGERPWDHVPFISFWSILKLVDLTALYYAIVGDAFVFCLVERRALAHALLALQLLACPRSALLLAGRPPFGHAESAASQALLAQCLWTCDLRAPRRTASRRAGPSPGPHAPPTSARRPAGARPLPPRRSGALRPTGEPCRARTAGRSHGSTAGTASAGRERGSRSPSPPASPRRVLPAAGRAAARRRSGERRRRGPRIAALAPTGQARASILRRCHHQRGRAAWNVQRPHNSARTDRARCD